MKVPNLKTHLAERLIDIASGGVLSRIDERGKRAGELYQWAINPHDAAPGSVLSIDDRIFDETYPLILGGKPVTENALFPIMSAVSNLNTAGLLVRRRKTHQQPHVSEVLELCRVAMECAASSIWILSGEGRATRIERCLRVEMAQLWQQKKFLDLSGRAETAEPSRYPAKLLQAKLEHRHNFNRMYETVEREYPSKKPPQFSQMVEFSARWVDLHVPPHDTGEIANTSMERTATIFYSYGSSFIHGYKWLTDYGREGAIWAMLADALAVSINMTECAACLFEGAAMNLNDLSGVEHFPKRLNPTVFEWSSVLFKPPLN